MGTCFDDLIPLLMPACTSRMQILVAGTARENEITLPSNLCSVFVETDCEAIIHSLKVSEQSRVFFLFQR